MSTIDPIHAAEESHPGVKKLVLKPTSRETDIRLIAMLHQWEPEGELPASSQRPRQVQWTNSDTFITYVEDTILNAAYLVIDGPNTERISDQVRKGLEVYEAADLDELRRSDLPADKAISLVNATVLAAPENFDSSVYDRVAAALRHPAEAVRGAALFAITYVPWKRFRDLLQSIRTEFPGMNADVDKVIEYFDKHGWA